MPLYVIKSKKKMKIKLFDDESDLLDKVGPALSSGRLSPVDLWMILLWEAKAAKGIHCDSLKKR